MSRLACHGLEVRRGGFVLRATLELAPGTITAACGPNGSGKSTLLLACAGLVDLAAGRVELDGRAIHHGRAPAPARLRRDLVLVHQDPYLLRGTVARNLSWGMRLRRVPGTERRARGARTLSALAIESLAECDVRGLSGGQQTLVAIARALVLEPAVLLLDEVTRDLDSEHRSAVIHALRERAARGAAVLLATHDPSLMELADRRVNLAHGEIASA